jgi:hypothetical protein
LVVLAFIYNDTKTSRNISTTDHKNNIMCSRLRPKTKDCFIFGLLPCKRGRG